MMTDAKFFERANKFCVFEEIEGGKFYTLEEYRKETEALQKNKDGKQVVIYTTNPVQQNSYIRAAQGKGYKVVKLETLVDAAFINQMETKWSDVHFTRVDADIADNLVDKNEKSESVLNAEQETKLKELFNVQVDQVHTQVEIKGLNPEAAPVVATRPEFMRRMKDMSAVGG